MAKKAKKEKPKLDVSSICELVGFIVKEHGDGVCRVGTKVDQCESIPTGSITLDIALGIGGIPRGRITEIYGPEASGKTTLTLEIAANVQRAGGTVAFIDVEHALDPVYADALGVNMDTLIISQPDCAEQALGVVETLCQSGRVDLVIVDSVAAFVTKAELEGEMGSAHMAGNARLLSQACRKLKGVVHHTNTALVFVNQIRMKIGVMFGSPETTTGGKALKYYSTCRIDIRRIASIKDGTDNIGNLVRTKIVKNKVAPPFKQAEFEIIFGKGINKTGCLLDAGVDYKIVDKNGSHYSYNNLKLGNGKVKACITLEDNPETMVEIRNRILEKLEALKAPKDDKAMAQVLEQIPKTVDAIRDTLKALKEQEDGGEDTFKEE